METLTEYINWSLATWEGLPLVLQSFILVVIFVSAMIESVKRSFLMSMGKVKRKKYIWLASAIISGLCGALGYHLAGDKIDIVYWIIIGGTAGNASNGLHWFSMNVIRPYIQKKFGKKEIV